MYAITVFQTDETGRRIDIAHFVRAASAPEVEDVVTALHKEFPAPGFAVAVENW
ncbi:hypothetical protein [Nonomuraea sp. NPDC049129]|uniref:hypothetical protein n=1 Tax=Nonomuraea sp. NPDC049129 TaxID=3155272 RepID=UPI0033D63064